MCGFFNIYIYIFTVSHRVTPTSCHTNCNKGLPLLSDFPSVLFLLPFLMTWSYDIQELKVNRNSLSHTRICYIAQVQIFFLKQNDLKRWYTFRNKRLNVKKKRKTYEFWSHHKWHQLCAFLEFSTLFQCPHIWKQNTKTNT